MSDHSKDTATLVEERRRVERALRESEERYKSLYEDIPVMYFTLGADGTILLVNTHGAEYLGYTTAELIGRPVSMVFFEEDWQGVMQQFQATLASPGVVRRWRFRKVRKDGSVLWVQEAARAVTGLDGKPIVLIVCEDVTERKLAEDRLVEQQEQLKVMASRLSVAQEGERRRIAVGIHDEISQTLAMAKLKLGVLITAPCPDGPDAKIDEVRDLIQQAIRASRSLTFELSSPVPYELGLDAMLGNLGEWFAERHGIHFRLDTEQRVWELADGVTSVVYRAVRQLLFNVMQHAQAGDVVIRVRGDDERIHVAVEDDGVGFDPAEAGKFSPRGGFGLFSIRQELKRVAGRLEIDSEPGEGTRATIVVPVDGHPG